MFGLADALYYTKRRTIIATHKKGGIVACRGGVLWSFG